MGSYMNRRSSVFMLSIVLVDQLTQPNEEKVKKEIPTFGSSRSLPSAAL